METPDDEAPADRQSALSQYREMMIEHLFVAEMWKEAWFRRKTIIEVLRSEVDASGYDLLLECGGVQRHVQLKASRKGTSVRHQNLNVNLAKRAGGCVVWIVFDEHPPEGLVSLRYWFFGGKAGEGLPSIEGLKIARHTKANMSGVRGQRPAIRILPRSRCVEVESASKLFAVLFGDEPGTPQRA